MEDLNRRVAALERGQDLIIGKLDGIARGIADGRLEIVKDIADGRLENEKRFSSVEGRLTGIETSLAAKASSADLRDLSGRVSSIPTTWQTIAIIAALLVGISGISFTISKLGEAPRSGSAPAATSPQTGTGNARP